MTDRLTSPDGRFELVVQPDGHINRWDYALQEWTTVLWPAPPAMWPLPIPVPPPEPAASRVEGFGIAYYTALQDPACNLAEWANRTRDGGSQHTRQWLMCAWANGWLEGDTAPGGIPGSLFQGYMPWRLLANGRYDLDATNPYYLERLDQLLTEFHRTGQHVCLSIWELYSWSARKANLLWVPNRDLQPQRNNIQGVEWGWPDDDTWLVTLLGADNEPANVTERLMTDVLATIGGRWPEVTLELGNEFPEKGAHRRLRDLLRRLGWQGRIQVNRNEDTPSQYDNMGIGQAYDSLSIHGRTTLDYLDEDFGPEQHKHRTFRAFYESGDVTLDSLVLSSDGSRKTTAVEDAYDYLRLVEVAQDALDRGYAYEHQSCIKLGRFSRGRLDLSDLQYDRQLFEELV